MRGRRCRWRGRGGDSTLGACWNGIARERGEANLFDTNRLKKEGKRHRYEDPNLGKVPKRGVIGVVFVGLYLATVLGRLNKQVHFVI